MEILRYILNRLNVKSVFLLVLTLLIVSGPLMCGYSGIKIKTPIF